MKPYNEMPVDYIHKHLIYDETSETFLRWKEKSKYSNIKIGDKAGVISRKYAIIKILGKFYMVHRVICVLHGLQVSNTITVDHLDGNSLNNNILNLQLKTNSENNRNKKKMRNNSSGINGVHRRVCTNRKVPVVYWCCNWVNADGLLRSKSFRVNGTDETLAMNSAIEYREQQIKQLEQNGIFYSKRHGELND